MPANDSMTSTELLEKLRQHGRISGAVLLVSVLLLLVGMILLLQGEKAYAAALLVPAILLVAFSLNYRRAVHEQQKIVHEQQLKDME